MPLTILLQTVYMDKCKTWYSAEDGTVIGLWPGGFAHNAVTVCSCLNLYTPVGSNLHSINALEHPRWEDYEYECVDDTPNRLFWLGDGQTMNERDMTGDREYTGRYFSRNKLMALLIAVAWYLNDVDVPPIPE